MSREQFIGDSAAQLADVVKGTLTTNYDFGAIAVFLTVVIATLDQQVGEDVIVPMSVSPTDEQMENWANRVLPKLNPFGIHDPRLRTSEFWMMLSGLRVLSLIAHPIPSLTISPMKLPPSGTIKRVLSDGSLWAKSVCR